MTKQRFAIVAILFAAFAMLGGTPAFAQDAAAGSVYAGTTGFGLIGAGYFFGLALAAVGAAFGLGKAVAAALEGTARQPEAANDIRTSMIIGCAFIEALAIYVLISPILASLFLTVK